MQAQDQLQPMLDTIEHIYGDTQVQLGIGAPTPETGTVAPGAAKVRIRHDLKPWEICASHIFSPLTAEQQRRRRMVANLTEQGEESDDEVQQASALAVSQRVSNSSPVY